MIGRQLGGRYEVLVKIGEGGMANVYSARDILLNRTVTVKMLKEHLASDTDFVRRFRREAQAAAVLSHPNIVNIFDVGHEGDVYYIVMEYVHGKTLKDLIRDKERLPADIAVELMRQITDAIINAHQNKVIHRDIKPQNILISRSGQAKVTDFGIAQAASTATVTCSDQVMGSVHYFSPEQARGNFAGEQSDVYSLGIVFYEMLTGQVPYSGDSPISVALKHLNEKITSPRELFADIPEPLEMIILKSVQKNPSRRYASAMDLRDDLVLWQQERRIKVAATGIGKEEYEENTMLMDPLRGEAGLDKEETHYRNGDKDNKKQKSRTGDNRPWWKKTWLLVLAGLMIFTLTLGGGYYLFRELIGTPDVIVPHLVGMDLVEAERLLEEESLVGRIEFIYDDEILENKVIAQDPIAGARVKKGREVILRVSQGTEELEVPEVTGLPRREAALILTREGLNYSDEEEFSAEVPTGHVIRQDPRPGVRVIKGEEVILYISTGPRSFPIRNLYGESEAAVKAYLEREGLILNREDWEYSERQAGSAIEQHPPAGTPVKAGDTVDIVWSKGPEPLEPPIPIDPGVNEQIPPQTLPDEGAENT